MCIRDRNYYEQGTTTKVADSKVVGDQTLGATATETAIAVPGYELVTEGLTESEQGWQASVEVAAEGSEINFYYAKRTDLSYTVNYYDCLLYTSKGVRTIVATRRARREAASVGAE